MDREINKDVRDYKAKLFGPFSFREGVGIVILAIGAYGMYALYRAIFGEAAEYGLTMALFCSAGAIPGALYGFIRPYNMNIEDFIKVIMVENYINPRILVLESENVLEEKKKGDKPKGPFSTKEHKAYK